MKSFKDFVVLKENRDESITGLDTCFGVISESGLSRLWQKAQNTDFCIITAYRRKDRAGKDRTKEDNVLANRELRSALNHHKLGGYPLVGHWQECELPDTPYDECPLDKRKDTIERSYFVPRFKDFDPKSFVELCFALAKKYDQDAIVMKVDSENLFGVYDSKTKDELVKFSKNIQFGKVQQAYSQYVKKLNVPFVFEGIETPTSLNFGKMAFRKDGFLWLE
jgi:hypothetical protein